MREAVIVDAVRTPMGRGKPGGSLAEVHPADLLSQVLAALVERNRLDPAEVDDLIIGCVTQIGEQSGVPGRMAWLAAGYPEHVPSVTLDRRCGSSQQAVDFAAWSIAAGGADIVIAGGVESMSRVTAGTNRAGRDPFGAGVAARYPGGIPHQGISAELIARKWGFGREDIDLYSVQSHHRAAAVREADGFVDEIIPVRTPAGTVDADETIRASSSVEGMAALASPFRTEELERRFPGLGWHITPGSSSQITDGAAALLLMSAEKAAALGLRPRARIVASAACGDDPVLMLTAPIPASRRVLAQAGLGIADIDHIEINEAFAPVPLAWQRELDADPDRLNPCGGAIALGHPLGASGARLMATMIHALERSGGRYGLQSMCAAAGMANATIIERL